MNSKLEKIIADYEPMYGAHTKKLIESLLIPNQKAALLNSFVDKSLLPKELSAAPTIIGMPGFVRKIDGENKPQIINNLHSHYFLDQSSLYSSLLLPIKPNSHVLDMCSAPGGKLLFMAMLHENIQITANDLSLSRFNRLKKVIHDYLPVSIQANIRLTNKDANYFGLKYPNSFDAILLDAPCSSEAHVVNNEKLLKNYKGLRKTVAHAQYSLLCAALLALKPGGYVMYATCSINKNENELLIKKALHKKSNLCSLISLKSTGLDTGFGISILPHVHKSGPAFFSLLQKNF